MLVNRADRPWLAVMVELETSFRYDPARSLDVAPQDERVLAPGASRTFPGDAIVGGYRRGRDVRLFLYEVSGSRAVLDTTRTLAHRTLLERGFRVEIP